MKKLNRTSLKIQGQKGSVAIVVAVSFILLLSFAAFAIDFGHRHVVKNELQNAADAAALAGVRQLYYDHVALVNAGQDRSDKQPDSANQVADDTAKANNAQGAPVEVNNPLSNEDDVQRGHWSFGLGTLAKGFYQSDNCEAITIANFSEIELDEMQNYVNAVKVWTRRQLTGTPVISFFAKIFGFGDYELSASAVAYIGFAGTILPGEVDQPIAICENTLYNDTNGNGEKDPDEVMDCSYGRMQNSDSKKDDDTNTGGWTNFSQNPCEEPTPGGDDLREILSDCSSGNTYPIVMGQGIGVKGGVADNIFGTSKDDDKKDSLFKCWKQGMWDPDSEVDGDEHPIDNDGDGWPEYPWKIRVPVIECNKNNVKNCSIVKGVVTVFVIWMQEKANNTDLTDKTPLKMYNPNKGNNGGFWVAPNPTRPLTEAQAKQNWDSFVTEFSLHTSTTDQLATYANDGFKMKTIYFLPNCEEVVGGAGGTGGTNYGIQAEIPVLVE